jgi:signal peptidase II|tara:strand:+ start:484 stop:978 length:495 start_codon:yes stop_codon:yes gene_type:complete
MDKFFFKKIILYFGIVLIVFLADRISKLYILSVLENLGEVDIYINSYINLILVWNTGVGFGLLSFDKSTIYNLITILIIFINLIILYLIIKSDKIRSYLFLIILGGSMGNLFDRIYYSAVPDFIDISYKGYHWFIFNIADIFISIGIICLIFVELMNYKKSDEN